MLAVMLSCGRRTGLAVLPAPCAVCVDANFTQRHREVHMDFGTQLVNIGMSLVLIPVVVLIFYGCFVVLNRVLFPRIDFREQLHKGNLAVGLFLAALVLGIFLLASKSVAADLDRYDDTFRKHARRNFGWQVHWTYFKGQGMTESGLNPEVCSGVGACGVMQFMPGTARDMDLADRFSAKASIAAGIRYDRRLWSIFSDPRPPLHRLALVTASYNWGAGNVIRKAQPCARARFGSDRLWEQVAPCLPEETREYWPRIQRWQRRFSARL